MSMIWNKQKRRFLFLFLFLSFHGRPVWRIERTQEREWRLLIIFRYGSTALEGPITGCQTRGLSPRRLGTFPLRINPISRLANSAPAPESAWLSITNYLFFSCTVYFSFTYVNVTDSYILLERRDNGWNFRRLNLLLRLTLRNSSLDQKFCGYRSVIESLYLLNRVYRIVEKCFHTYL